MNSRWVPMVCLAAVVGCSDEESSKEVGTVSTKVEGVFYFGLDESRRKVELKAIDDGRVVCETTSEDGAFSCDLGPYYGDVMVEVDLAREWSFKTAVVGLEIGEERTVPVTPATHLMARRMEYLVKGGVAPKEAYEENRFLLEEHLGGVGHSRVVPDNVYQKATPVMLETVVAGVMMAGLEELAGWFSDENEKPRGGLEDTLGLIEVLAEDVAYDGVFDGQGEHGQFVIGQALVTGDTMRSEYARSMLRFLRSESNATGIDFAEFVGMAERMSENRSALFVSEPSLLDQDRPKFTQVDMYAGDGSELGGRPVGGRFVVVVVAEDDSGVESIRLRIEEGEYVENESSSPGCGHFSVDTADLEDGLHRVEVSARDTKGNEAKVTMPFTADNTVPSLSLSLETNGSSDVVSSRNIELRVQVSDSVGPLKKVEIIQGDQHVEVFDPEAEFTVPFELSDCNTENVVLARAEDAAGNVTEERLRIRCDSVPPHIVWAPSTYHQEGSLQAMYSEDGETVRYVWDQSPTLLQLGASWPVNFEKYYNRFDSWSENLPVLRVQSSDGSGAVSVEYRYMLNGAVLKDWTVIEHEVGDPTIFALPLSYQTLDARVGDSEADELHRVEMRSRDGSGNASTIVAEFEMEFLSPPVWVGGCRISPTLSQFSISNGRLSEIYVSRPETEVVEAEVRFSPELAPGSLAPSGSVLVDVEGDVRSRITMVTESKYIGPIFDISYVASWSIVDQRAWMEAPGGVLWCGYSEWCHAELMDVEIQDIESHPPQSRAYWTIGPWTTTRTIWDAATDGPANDDLEHQYGVEMFGTSGAQALVSGSSHVVLRDDPHRLSLNVIDPEIVIESTPYGFDSVQAPTGYQVPQGYGMPDSWNSLDGLVIVPQLRTVPFSNRVRDRLRWFISRAFISGFEIHSEPLEVTAEHADLRYVDVGVVYSSDCTTKKVYR